jgi:lactoylglutathione lyase
MKLNHINLAVTDVPAAATFLETYFGLRHIEGAPRDQSLDVLLDDDGLVLTLMRAGQAKEISYPGFFHVGFIQPSAEAVDELNRRLKDDGYDPKPPRRFHGSWTFYFTAPGGFRVEVLH